MQEKYPQKPNEEVVPEKSQIENETEEVFNGMKIETEADLDRTITNVFSEICGDYGRQEFLETTLPAIKAIYSTNYRKAGLRLLEIIDEGAERKPEEIGAYFKNIVSREEIEYSKKSKEEVLADIISQINSIILEKRNEYGEKYKGVIAAIIYGSFARKNFSLNSDLDIIYISESRENSEYFEDEEKYVNYAEDFEYSLGRKIRPVTDNFYGTCYIGDKDKFRIIADEKDSLVKDAYIVVSPYPDIKTKIEALLNQQ